MLDRVWRGRRLPGNRRWREGVIPALVATVALGIIMPLPAGVVDGVTALAVAAAIGSLVAVVRIPDAQGLTSLPAMTVVLTGLRLFSGVATGRWIAAHGTGTPLLAAVTGLGGALGGWPELLGLAVVLGVIQVTVVSSGASRAAEVAARFALDSLSIGHADDRKAGATESTTQAEAAFYAAMDGATRFLRGEVPCLALIGVSAAVGGCVADGAASDLTSAIGAASSLGALLLMAAAFSGAGAALAVMRGSARRSFASEAFEQLLADPWPTLAGGLACLGLGLWSVRQGLASLLVGAGLAAAGVHGLLRGGNRGVQADPLDDGLADDDAAGALHLRLGLGLLGLLTPEGGDLVERLAGLRADLSACLGLRLPGFVVSDSVTLGLHEYALEVQGAPAARGSVRPSRLLAIADSDGVVPHIGEAVVLPDRLPGVWVSVGQRPEVEALHCAILSPVDAILRHVASAVRSSAWALFDRQAAADMIAAVLRTHPATAAAAAQVGITDGKLTDVGQELLRQSIPLIPPVSLLDALARSAGRGDGFADTISEARIALAPAVTRALAPDGDLYALQLEPDLASELADSLYRQTDRLACGLRPERARQWRIALEQLASDFAPADRPLAVLCDTSARRALGCLLQGEQCGRLVVVEPQEILPGARLHVVHCISQAEIAAGPALDATDCHPGTASGLVAR